MYKKATPTIYKPTVSNCYIKNKKITQFFFLQRMSETHKHVGIKKGSKRQINS